jgi:hypothetical protein
MSDTKAAIAPLSGAAGVSVAEPDISAPPYTNDIESNDEVTLDPAAKPTPAGLFPGQDPSTILTGRELALAFVGMLVRLHTPYCLRFSDQAND